MVKSKQRGFTLIELMMVVAIIGILASIAVPSYQAYVYRAKAVEVVVLIDRIHTVLSDLQSEEGAPIGSALGVWRTQNAQASDPALQFARQKGESWVRSKPVPGLSESELVQLQRLGINVSVSSGVVNTRQSGQFKVSLNMDYSPQMDPKRRLQAQQLALATEHVMRPATYKTTISSDGSVGMYFQLGGK